MKKFLITAVCVLALLTAVDWLYYYQGVLYLPHEGGVSYSSKAQGDALYLDRGHGLEVFDIKGVNLGMSKPGYYATEFAATKEEYLRWFEQIQAMGANVIRIYVLANDTFYEAFYTYNLNNPDPLYLIHGVGVDDYLINSSCSALDKEFYEPFLQDCKAVVDTIHGRYKQRSTNGLFPNTYRYDISPWVYGYIWGIDWDSNLVTYTDRSFDQLEQLSGTYFYTENANNFEIFLASIAEEVTAYETEKYGTQRVAAFSNWAITDPMEYDSVITDHFKKAAKLDVEHIKCTDAFAPGQFASYHIYPYYPDYDNYKEVHEANTYLQYLTEINDHHTMPVLISEFGVPSSRGMAAYEASLGRNQGFMSEDQQGEALVSMYQDIQQAGSAGGIVFTWQDEWFKHTWNTMHGTNLNTTAYWSDYQSNEQHFGLLSFDPGRKQSVCYVDGDRSEWQDADLVQEQNGLRLSMKYDQQFIYFLVEREGLDPLTDTLYLPIDTTPKSGSLTADAPAVEATQPMDFIIQLDGTDNSRVLVQERYNTLYALFGHLIFPSGTHQDIPESDSPVFQPIQLLLQYNNYYEKQSVTQPADPDTDRLLTVQQYNPINLTHYGITQTYETGQLLYGNANPQAADFNSLADFCGGDGFVEIRLPWSLLNFSSPPDMTIHDDYYECYGVEYQSIDHINLGVGDGTETIEMVSAELKKLGRRPEYHERLKQSYYILQEFWTGNGT